MGIGILGKLIGGGIGEMADGVAGAIDRFVETDEEKNAAEILKRKIQQKPDEWQVQLNQIEARHRSIFVAGWRPAVGWVCVFGLAYTFIIRPFGIVVLNVLSAMGKLPEGLTAPAIETGELLSLLFGMLGLGALRSYEKKAGLTG